MSALLQAPAAEIDPRPLAPAVFRGLQEGFGVIPDFEIYNLTASIPGHPEHSTVSRQTLEQAGYRVPAAPEPATVDGAGRRAG